jgi:hypothetical protein
MKKDFKNLVDTLKNNKIKTSKYGNNSCSKFEEIF